MKKEIKHRLQAIVLTAIASALQSESHADNLKRPVVLPVKDKTVLSSSKSKWNTILNNVVKITRNGDFKIVAGHRSHSSHSSHRSHYSSRGGSNHYSSSSSYTSGSKGSYVGEPSKSPSEYILGERTLKVGNKGEDASELANLLVKNFYLEKSKIKRESGYVIYNESICQAVKRFQKDAELKVTGIADKETIERLKRWNADNSKNVPLGLRVLKKDISGTDVTELVQLLVKSNFAPNPDEIRKTNSVTYYSEDIGIAVSLFQAHNGLQVTGEADLKTIKALRSKK